MKKAAIIAAIVLAASGVCANYVAFIGQNNNPAAPIGGLVDDNN